MCPSVTESISEIVDAVERLAGVERSDIADVVELAFASSLLTEEAEATLVDLIYFDTDDPRELRRTVTSRQTGVWKLLPLDLGAPTSAKQIAKLAPSTDPRVSAIAISHGAGGLAVEGVVDQSPDYFDFMLHGIVSRADIPGSFRISVIGPGRLRAFKEFRLVAELGPTGVMSRYVDVLRKGVVYDKLFPGKAKAFRESNAPTWDEEFARKVWWGALSRLLLRIQRFGHGGAILIAPPADAIPFLDVKYQALYDGINLGAIQTLRAHPEPLQSDASQDLEMHRGERMLDHAIWHVSYFSRVDGLVLIDDALRCHGYGAMTRTPVFEGDVRVARTSTDGGFDETISADSLGSRHRSKISMVSAVPHSVGFVVSQDGTVRAVTLHDGAPLMFEPVKVLGAIDPYASGRMDIRDIALPRT